MNRTSAYVQFLSIQKYFLGWKYILNFSTELQGLLDFGGLDPKRQAGKISKLKLIIQSLEVVHHAGWHYASSWCWSEHVMMQYHRQLLLGLPRQNELSICPHPIFINSESIRRFHSSELFRPSPYSTCTCHFGTLMPKNILNSKFRKWDFLGTLTDFRREYRVTGFTKIQHTELWRSW